MRIEFGSLARRELFDAAEYYEDRATGLGDRFLDEVARVLGRLKETPIIWPVYHHTARRIRIRRFPYSIVYEVSDDLIVIHAVAHLKRPPEAPGTRLPDSPHCCPHSALSAAHSLANPTPCPGVSERRSRSGR